ncbi:MAG: LysE family translocator [Pseudomonadota bacterium]
MPEPDAILAFVIIVTLIVTSPGPNLFLLLRTTPSFGRAAGLANTFGFSAAIMTHAALSLMGVGAIIATSALAFSILKIAGAAYLAWLGIKALRSAWKGGVSVEVSGAEVARPRAEHRGLATRFAEGFLTNILNPKPALFYLAAFPQFIALSGFPILVQGMTLGVIHAAIAILWYGSVVLGIATVSRWLRRPAVWRWVQGISGTALVVLAGRLLVAQQAT